MTDFPLSMVMTRSQPLTDVVVVDGATSVGRAVFVRRVRQWMLEIEKHSAQVFAVYLEDAGEFAALMMALWQCGKTPLLAGDNLPTTVGKLSDHAGVLVGDFPVGSGLEQVSAPANDADELETAFQRVSRVHTAVIVLTSGSTGEPRPVAMTVGQLEDEVAMHETRWRNVAEQSLVVGTVTHQHVYGLIWRVLWPLAGQRPFARHYSHYLEDVLAWADSHHDLVLVTTPSHLGRLPAQADWKSARGAWRMVVSSTAPLLNEDSRAAEECFGVPVTEIFGSSETGGIAWRQQQLDPVWRTLPGITVSLGDTDPIEEETAVDLKGSEGPLVIRSPLLGHDHWFATGDQARIESSDRFSLLGRVDRIAKIEGKRVSLTAMEKCLLEHSWVREARLLVLGGHRVRCAVVATLTAEGMDGLDRLGRRTVSQTLRTWMADSFEAPVLPRHWRFPDELPRNTQGKVPQPLLASLFEEHGGPLSQPWLPELLSSEVSDSGVILGIRIQPELVYFHGHFPEVQVLPGVVQVHWAEYFARILLVDRLPPGAGFVRMEVVKFQQLIQPAREVTLQMSFDSKSRLNFRFHDGDDVFSSGRLVFSDRDVA